MRGSTLHTENDLHLIEDRFSVSETNIRQAPEPYWVLGLDEVGRGCIAGPVTAACAAYPLTQELLTWKPDCRVIDSKKLSEKARKLSEEKISESDQLVTAVAECSPQEIDEINILNASLKAMLKAAHECLEQIPTSAQIFVLVDGNKLPPLDKLQAYQVLHPATVIKGDSKSFAIAAASILAKESRDNFMQNLSKVFHADYGWASNVGYPTPSHKAAVHEHGRTEWHRNSFRI